LTVDPDVLRAERFPEVGSLIRDRATSIVERWCQRAVANWPNAARVHHDALRDQLPSLLAALGECLATCHDAEPLEQQYSAAREHGEQRWDQGWSLAEVVRDYMLLRLVLLEFLDESIDRPLSLREAMAIGMAIDEAVGASIASHAEFEEKARRQRHDDHVAAERRVSEALRRAADRMSEAKHRTDHFLAVLGHELRNPLSPIMYAVEAARLMQLDSSSLAATWDVIERQAGQISRLVDDLLDVTRLSLGKMPLRKSWVELGEIVRQAAQACAPMFDARQQSLILSVVSPPLELDADPARLVQVISNLLINASKYSPANSRIWLRAGRDGSEMLLTVRDEGIGISPELLENIFDLYRQIEPPLGHSPDGLGIGLALVRSLVELHGGRVAAFSEGANRGSEFAVRLPIGSGLTASEASSPRPPRAAARVIVIVEDNRDSGDMLAELLMHYGHRATVARTAAEGLAAIERAMPDLALIDIGLPDMDGYQLAALVRRLPSPKRATLVALTGFGTAEDRERAQAAGFDSHLLKPVRFDDLTRLVESLPD
jgi:signal transduction histidine kinase